MPVPPHWGRHRAVCAAVWAAAPCPPWNVSRPALLAEALEGTRDGTPREGSFTVSAMLRVLLGALQAHADPSVISCLHTLSRRIATVLQHEERRCQYLTREAKLILALQDEVSAMADGERAGGFSRPGPLGLDVEAGGLCAGLSMPWAHSKTLEGHSETQAPELMLREWVPSPKCPPPPRPPHDGSSRRSDTTLVLLGSLPGVGACGRAASSWKEATSLLSAELTRSPIELSAGQLLKVIPADRSA